MRKKEGIDFIWLGGYKRFVLTCPHCEQSIIWLPERACYLCRTNLGATDKAFNDKYGVKSVSLLHEKENRIPPHEA